ncbi:mucoidy inhibitor MuiA family protein [uncultured Arcticibacterium sp.]|uniref:mucoidy inhibitor MuiA family protein n=1 Tax=uncultured Arcticibacterium sp. TaxID=2173042 RepID=UPI0030F96342
MKKHILLFLFTLPLLAIGQEVKVNTKISKVNLYFSGAQISREAEIDLNGGENTLVFKGISPEIDKSSIKVSTDLNINIASLSHQMSLQSDSTVIQATKKVNDANKKINEQFEILKVDLTLLKREEELLLANQTVGGTYSGMKPEDLKVTADYFRERMKLILTQRFELSQKLDSLQGEVRKNNITINTLSQKKENQLAEIILVLKTKAPVKNQKLTISYFVKNAGWTPSYDIKATKITEPISLLYKAKVYQYSGEDWKDIKLTLSNTSPKNSSNIPSLKKWYWGENNSYSDYFNKKEVLNNDRTQVWGIVKDSQNLPLPGASITIVGTSLGTTTDENGFFRLNIPPDLQKKTNILSISFVGFESQNLNAANSPFDISLIEDTRALEEVTVMGYTSKSKRVTTGAALLGRVAGVSIKNESSIRQSRITKKLISEDEAPTSLNFTLDSKFTLLSDGKENTTELKELEIPTDFEYKTVPKIDPVAFLTARIFDWEQYNLIEGEASLYFEGTYLGKTDLDLSNKDTLSISLGRDQAVKVQRKPVRQFSKNQFIGGNAIDTYGYEISIRNTKSVPIKILVEDQFPLSKFKEVEIYDKSAIGANENQETGELLWLNKIEPFTEKTLPFSYTIKYPKNGSVSY